MEYARRSGCDTIAHGCTGKGNDQVQIRQTVIALDPGMKIIAPVRGWRMGREEEIVYAREHGIPVKGGTEAPPYSIDDNLWGRSSEGGAIEDLEEPPRDDVFQLVTRPEEAPDEPEDVVVGFERGVPVSLNGERLELVELLERAGEVGSRHGIGIVDHIEDRIVGLKVRDLYEVPAAALVLTAHKELEKLVGTIHQNTFKPTLDAHWAYLVYAGLWYEPLLSDLNAFMDAVNEQVTGEITMRLYKGSARPVARRSPNALYDPALAGFGESGGCSPSRRARASSSSGRSSRAWHTTCATGKKTSDDKAQIHRVRLDRVADRLAAGEAQDGAEQAQAGRGREPRAGAGGRPGGRQGDRRRRLAAPQDRRGSAGSPAGGASARSPRLPRGRRERPLSSRRWNLVPIVTSRWSAPRAMKKAVGAVSSEKPATNGIAMSSTARP